MSIKESDSMLYYENQQTLLMRFLINTVHLNQLANLSDHQ